MNIIQCLIARVVFSWGYVARSLYQICNFSILRKPFSIKTRSLIDRIGTRGGLRDPGIVSAGLGRSQDLKMPHTLPQSLPSKPGPEIGHQEQETRTQAT